MAVCVLFGHRDCPQWVRQPLREALIELIEQQGVRRFYLGNQGAFDRMARSVLRELAAEYPEIDYTVVLAYVPQPGQAWETMKDTMLPEGIETVSPRYAIVWRNRWMLRQADCVVAYITRDWGGAAQFVRQAQRQNKPVIFLPVRL